MSANNPCNLSTAHLPTPEATDFASSCRSLCQKRLESIEMVVTPAKIWQLKHQNLGFKYQHLGLSH